MSQGSLFDASVYIRRAYDQLVLAYNEVELEEIAMLKNAVLRAYVGTRESAYEQIEFDHPTEDQTGVDAPF